MQLSSHSLTRPAPIPGYSIAVLLLLCTAFAGCSQQGGPTIANAQPGGQATGESMEQAASEPAEVSDMAPEKLAVEHLPNAYRIHPKVISGGLPEDDDAFAELESLGVKTVISVDGAKPDVELAKRHGMRYVHLPHGYDGIPEETAQKLAKAVRELEGPVYIHCHHGKHRSPAAAAVACVSAGMLPPDKSLAVLQAAGTSKNYRGLYQSAESARKLESKLLDELAADFPETAPIPPMAEAMIGIEHAHDHLKALAAHDWRRLEKQPDLDPAHEALLLREHFTELLRTEAAMREPEGFQQLLREGEAAAQSLEDALRTLETAPSDEQIAASKMQLEVVSKNCSACHQKYRDVPLGEKESSKSASERE